MRNVEAIPAFIVFSFMAVIAAMFIVLAIAAQQQQRRELLERIANRFRGRVQSADWFSFPQVRLQFQGYPALLRFTRVGRNRHHTQFTITWPEPQFRCEVYPQDILSAFRRLLGMEDIEIGSRQFDAAYYIIGNNKAAVRELLSADVQGAIFKLAAISRFGFAKRDIQVKWVGGVLTITKPCHLSTFESLEKLISLSAELFVAALASRASGIEFVDEVQEPDAAPSQCQVCGEPLTKDLVYCASCRTPHHRECWEYFGGCSTYACGQKKYIRQPSKRAKAS